MFTIQSRLVSDAKTKSQCQNAITKKTLPQNYTQQECRNIVIGSSAFREHSDQGHNSSLKLPPTKSPKIGILAVSFCVPFQSVNTTISFTSPAVNYVSHCRSH